MTTNITTLQPGYVAAITLKPDSAPLRSYVGEVQAVDEHGVRLTLVDWLIGTFSGYDLFVPWDALCAALVATDEHDIRANPDAFSKWQTRMITPQEAQED